VVDCCECGNEPPSSIKWGGGGYVACFLPGRAKDLSVPLYCRVLVSCSCLCADMCSM